MFKIFYRLAKPGIVYGNAIAATAGFLLAADGHIDWALYLAMLSGLSLVIASACVFNNYLDQDIDARMSRTQKRALPSGQISSTVAIIYGSVLGAAGFTLLGAFTNRTATLSALTGFLLYIFVYGYFKRRSLYGTIIGSLAGAMPPVVGYTAVSGQLDANALILFLILLTWQMPHFYAISIFRLKDYSAAGVPVWPIKRGLRDTKLQIVFFIVLFILSVLALSLFGSGGITYLVVGMALGLYWLNQAAQGFKAKDNVLWARHLFRSSLLVLLLLSAAISLNGWLP